MSITSVSTHTHTSLHVTRAATSSVFFLKLPKTKQEKVTFWLHFDRGSVEEACYY